MNHAYMYTRNMFNRTTGQQVVSQNSEIISPISVDAVLSVIDPATATNVDLNDVKIVKQVTAWTTDRTLGLCCAAGWLHVSYL